MKKILLLVLLIIPLLIVQAQKEYGENIVQKVDMALGFNGEGVKEKVMYFQVPFEQRAIFATVAFKFYRIQEEDISVDIAYADNNGQFTEWKPLHFEQHLPENSDFIVTELETVELDYDRLRIRISTPMIKNFKSEAHWFLPPTDFSFNKKTLPQTRLAANCILPDYVTRVGWNCPSGEAYSTGNPSFTNVTHLVVHHSAGSNTSSNWAATVLSIWNYHVFTNGWSDIAYNLLVDPNGVIYEGRGGNSGYTLDVLNAATCGSNSGQMAVCLLGNFETAQPSQAALTSLESLLAWKANDRNIDPLGSSTLNNFGVLNHIFGHQQGCATACPGLNLFNKLPIVRQSVADEINNGCDLGVPEISTGTLTIDDNNEGDSQGNVNGMVDAGETIEMFLTITNSGDIPLNNVVATISTTNPCVSYIDNDIAFGNLSVGQTVTSGDFDVIFGANCADGDIPFLLTYTFNEGIYTHSIVIHVVNPVTCQLPQVNFIASPLSGPSPLNVQVGNQTTGGLSYFWTITGPETYNDIDEHPVLSLITPGLYNFTLVAFNECGQQSLTKPNYVEVLNVTGTEDNHEMVAAIYPNPVKKKLTVEFNTFISDGAFIIINTAGQKVLVGSFSGSTEEINVKDLSSGTYILRIINNDQPEQSFNYTFIKKQ